PTTKRRRQIRKAVYHGKAKLKNTAKLAVGETVKGARARGTVLSLRHCYAKQCASLARPRSRPARIRARAGENYAHSSRQRPEVACVRGERAVTVVGVGISGGQARPAATCPASSIH